MPHRKVHVARPRPVYTLLTLTLFASLGCALFAFAQKPKPKPAQDAKPAQGQPTPTPEAEGRGIQRTANTQAMADAARKLDEVQSLPGKTKRFALVIGVDAYDDSQVVGLNGAASDARLLADSLVHDAGFPADQVVLLASDQAPERQPTRGNILRRLSNLAAVVPKDGLLLFSFAGHGMERSGQAFLLPSDAQVSDDVTLLEQTAINVIQIKDWIRKTGVGQVLLLLDACRNDPAAGRAAADNKLSTTYTKAFDFDVRNREVQAFATLYATEIGRRAYELKEQRHGYFTLALVEALRGKAANARGEVTLSSLISYLQSTVPRRVLLDLGQGKEQRPFAVVEGYRADELVLSVRDPKTPVRPVAEERAIGLADSGVPSAHTRPAAPKRVEPEDAGGALAGTLWRGLSPESGEYTVEFLPNGKLNYSFDSIENGKKVVKVVGGTWTQVGSNVQFEIGSYSTWTGTLEGGALKGEMSNLEGVSRKITLLPKKRP
ncbi:MAG TPA: caspase family protein [Pyrinomonadaceae bacterium]|jgi:hypothetical protein